MPVTGIIYVSLISPNPPPHLLIHSYDCSNSYYHPSSIDVAESH